MIKLTGEHGQDIWINPHYIVAVCQDDRRPDMTAVYDLTVGSYWLVKEAVKTIVNMIHAEENTAHG